MNIKRTGFLSSALLACGLMFVSPKAIAQGSAEISGVFESIENRDANYYLGYLEGTVDFDVRPGSDVYGTVALQMKITITQTGQLGGGYISIVQCPPVLPLPPATFIPPSSFFEPGGDPWGWSNAEYTWHFHDQFSDLHSDGYDAEGGALPFLISKTAVQGKVNALAAALMVLNNQTTFKGSAKVQLHSLWTYGDSWRTNGGIGVLLHSQTWMYEDDGYTSVTVPINIGPGGGTGPKGK